MQNNSPLSTLIHSQAEIYGSRTAMKYKDYVENKWKDISWNTFSEKVRLVSNAMMELGIGIQENVAVFSQNMPECMYVDFGAYAIRAVTIPFYATSSETQVKYMVSDAKIRYIFVGEQYQYDTAYRVLKIEHCVCGLIIFDRSVKKDEQDKVSMYFDEFLEMGATFKYQTEIEQRTAELDQDDLANILYTSGTTGLSKGVMLTHRMFNAAIRAHEGVLNLSDSDLVMNFLPFTHVFERGWSYLCIATGCTLAVNLRPTEILQSLREVHPTCMCAVPRFWEKVYAGVQEKINTSSPIQRKMLEDALRVGKEYNVNYKMKGLEPPLTLKMQYLFYEKTVIALLLKTLGLERHNFFPTAGAAISKEVEEFIHSAGIMMIVGYGLTESTATVSADRWNRPITIGSVGRLLDGVQLKFGENNEILLKGDTITKGYYRKAARLCVDRYIDQVVIIADQKKFVSALVIPEYKLLEQYAQSHNIAFQDREDLCRNEQVVQFVLDRLETMQQDLAYFEQVKRITLLPEPLSLERGELTNTLKVKRPVINERYKEQIDKMYKEEDLR